MRSLEEPANHILILSITIIVTPTDIYSERSRHGSCSRRSWTGHLSSLILVGLGGCLERSRLHGAKSVLLPRTWKKSIHRQQQRSRSVWGFAGKDRTVQVQVQGPTRGTSLEALRPQDFIPKDLLRTSLVLVFRSWDASPNGQFYAASLLHGGTTVSFLILLST